MKEFLDLSTKIIVSAVLMSVVGGLFNALLSLITGFIGNTIGSDFVGVIFLAIAAGFMALAIAVRPGVETLMSLPRVLILTAVVSLIGLFIPSVSLNVTGTVITSSAVAQLGAFAVLLSEAWLSLGLVERFMPDMKQ